MNGGWQVYALASAFFAGLTAIFGKMGVENINSNMATLIRTVVIFFVTILIVTFRSEWQRLDSISSRTYVFLVLSGIATGASWLCYYRALQLGPASKVAPVDKLSVAFAIVLAVLVLGEKMTLKSALGAGFVVLGSVILAL